MATFLVTGGAGFIGSWVVHEVVKRGHRVIAVDCFLEDSYDASEKHRAWRLLPESDLVTKVEIDLAEPFSPDLVSEIDIIINEAGMPGLVKSWDNFDVYSRSNLAVVANLLASIRFRSDIHFVQVSTSSVYGLEAIGNEDAVPQPISPYGVTKLAAEELVKCHARTFGTRFTILRYFSVYGPGQRPDMAYRILIDAALRGDPFRCFGDGEQSRTNTFVRDCAAATVDAALLAPDNMVLNIAGTEPVSLNDVVSLVQEITGREIHIDRQPERPGDQRVTKGDTRRAQEILGFNPTTSLADGLREQVAWQRSLNEP